jgi:hypothetical protein
MIIREGIYIYTYIYKNKNIRGKSTLPLEVSGVFQFEPLNLKIGNVLSQCFKNFNSDILLLIFV